MRAGVTRTWRHGTRWACLKFQIKGSGSKSFYCSSYANASIRTYYWWGIGGYVVYLERENASQASVLSYFHCQISLRNLLGTKYIMTLPVSDGCKGERAAGGQKKVSESGKAGLQVSPEGASFCWLFSEDILCFGATIITLWRSGTDDCFCSLRQREHYNIWQAK